MYSLASREYINVILHYLLALLCVTLEFLKGFQDAKCSITTIMIQLLLHAAVRSPCSILNNLHLNYTIVLTLFKMSDSTFVWCENVINMSI